MKRILCYGDSNTWGFKPLTGFPFSEDRFPKEVRWTGILEREIDDNYEVIEEGLNGRTTVWDDPIEEYKNGKKYLPPCIESHKPLDLVVIMLGSNDMKKRFSTTPYDVAEGAGVLVDIVKKSETGPDGEPPQVLLVSPPEISDIPHFVEGMFEDAEEKSQQLSKHYERIAKERGCHFLDASDFVKPTSSDGLHLEEDDHKDLGKAMASKIRELDL